MEKPRFISGKMVVEAFIALFAMQYLVAPTMFVFGWSWWTHIPTKEFPLRDPILGGWISLTGILLAFAAFTLILIMQNPLQRMALWFLPNGQKHKWYQDVLYGAGICCLSYPAVVVLNGATVAVLNYFGFEIPQDQIAVKMLKGILEDTPLLISMSVALVTFVPFVEELLFRGFLQQWIKGFAPVNISVAVTAFLFAAIHCSWSQGLENIPLFLSLLLLAFILGYVREERGLWASMGLHSCFNIIGVVLIIAFSGE